MIRITNISMIMFLNGKGREGSVVSLLDLFTKYVKSLLFMLIKNKLVGR